MLSRRLPPITVGLVAALLAGCNNARTPEPASGAPVAATQRVAPSDVALPEGAGCSGAIARYRAIMDNDRAMGHVNQGVYDKIQGEIGEAQSACASGQDAHATSLIRASKARHGYPG